MKHKQKREEKKVRSDWEFHQEAVKSTTLTFALTRVNPREPLETNWAGLRGGAQTRFQPARIFSACYGARTPPTFPAHRGHGTCASDRAV